MYCIKCGKEIPNNSKFCNGCGFPVVEKSAKDFEAEQQPEVDVVEDIKKKLQEIDNRKRPTAKKGGIVKSAFASMKNAIREEAAASGLTLFDDGFEEKKLADKKALIQNYPLPTSPKALASFAKYINSNIVAKINEPDDLTPIWKEKLKKVYIFAKAELSSTKEFVQIQKYYKANKKRERLPTIRLLVLFLACFILIGLIESIVFQKIGLIFLCAILLFVVAFSLLFLYLE